MNRQPHTYCNLRLIIAVLAAMLILVFLLPVFIGGIINIGNITGLFIASVILICSLFFDKVSEFAAAFYKTLSGKIIIICICAFLSIILIITAYITYEMISAPDNSDGADTVIVLGCKVNGKTPSIMLTERLDTALDYLKRNADASCILSGGKGTDENISEAQAMYSYLTDAGISPSRLYMEDKSTSTRENIKFSKQIMEKNSLGGKIAVITNEFHCCRAKLISKKEGIDVQTVAAPSMLPLLPTYYIRELYAVLAEIIFG